MAKTLYLRRGTAVQKYEFPEDMGYSTPSGHFNDAEYREYLIKKLKGSGHVEISQQDFKDIGDALKDLSLKGKGNPSQADTNKLNSYLKEQKSVAKTTIDQDRRRFPKEAEARERETGQYIPPNQKAGTQPGVRGQSYQGISFEEYGTGGWQNMTPDERRKWEKESGYNAARSRQTTAEIGGDNRVLSDTQKTTYTKDGKPFDPSKFTNLQPGTEHFENWLRENRVTAAQAGGSRELGPTEFQNLLREWKASGLTDKEIEQNFLDRSGGQISLKTNAPSTESIIGRRSGTTDATGAAGGTEGQAGATNTEIDKWLQELYDSGEIDDYERGMLDEILNNDDYTSGARIKTKEEIERIVSDAELNATADLDPHFSRIRGREVENLRNTYADLRNESLRYQQQEAKGYKQALADTKQKLRASGLTFSGQGRQTLGKEGALASAGVEGELPQQRRFNYEDYGAGLQERSRNVGLAAERRLGSGGLSGADVGENRIALPFRGGINYQAGATKPIYSARKEGQEGYVGIGDIALERKRAIEQSKQDRIKAQRIY